MRADLMSFSIFLFLTGTENIFVWFGRVYFFFPSLLSFPTSRSLPLLSKHSKPRTVAEPCPPRGSPSCSATPGLIPQELWAGSRDTKIQPLGRAASQKQDALGIKRHLSLANHSAVQDFSLCPSRGASLEQLWLKKRLNPYSDVHAWRGMSGQLPLLLPQTCSAGEWTSMTHAPTSSNMSLPKAR